MRGTALLLAIVLSLPLAGAFLHLPSVDHWELPTGAAPQLTPPNPAVQSWPQYQKQGPLLSPPTPAQTTGTSRAIILLVRFTDAAADPAHDQTYYEGRLNAEGGSARSLRSYYREVSLGALTVNATIISTWWPSSHTMAYYGQDSATGVDDANGPIYRLVVEAVKAADAAIPSVNFAPFDTNGDGVVDHLIVVHAGSGQEAGGGTDLIWSHRWAVLDADPATPGSQSLTADAVQIYGYMMVAEDFALGVVAHEFGHDLGLPDLYDTDGTSHGAGVWDIMAEGSWTGSPAGSSPAHMSAWSRLRLGWVTPTDVTTARVGTPIPAVESSGLVFRLGIPGTPNEYFLIENREPIGTDAGLPGSGLLLWHVDDSRASNDQDDHRLVDLIEADESVSGDRPVDSTDPWRDTASGWGPDTVPDSRAYGGTATNWRIRDVSAAGSTMTATIARDVTKDVAVSAIRVPFTVASGTTFPAVIDVRNEGAQSANLTLQLDLYRGTIQPAARVTTSTFVRGGVAAQTTLTFWQNFTPTATGRYIVRAALLNAADEIGSNDERVAHVLVNSFQFWDDMTSGLGWTTNGFSNDPHRWRIVSDTDPDGASHSRTRAWRFGHVATLLPNPLPPEWHTLTSAAINVAPGPTFLIFYQRHDLTGRTLPVLPIGANDTDEAFVEVRYGSGPWVSLARYTGRDLAWRGSSFNLTVNITGSTTLQVRFNASSNVMGNSGGWWIDDVMIASVGLGRAAVLLGPSGPIEGLAGGTVRFDAKLANIGDYETDFRLDVVLPAGWDAGLEGGTGGILRGHVVRLAPDNDASLRIVLSIPSNVSAGTTYPVTITTAAVGDPTADASMAVQVRVASDLPLDPLLLSLLVMAAILIAVIAVVVALRRRRPRL